MGRPHNLHSENSFVFAVDLSVLDTYIHFDPLAHPATDALFDLLVLWKFKGIIIHVRLSVVN